jgi:hypothetical protein
MNKQYIPQLLRIGLIPCIFSLANFSLIMPIHLEIQVILCGNVGTMRNLNTILKKITAKQGFKILGFFTLSRKIFKTYRMFQD